MKPFMDSDFLLQTDTAKKLYHDYAKQVPVLDYHCHLVPKEIAGIYILKYDGAVVRS